MKKKNIHELKFSEEEYKKIKKGKKKIILNPNVEVNKKDIIKFVNNDTGKNFKRKVKKVNNYSNVNEINKKKLGLKKKDEIEIKDKNIIGVEIKVNSVFHKIFDLILAVILIILLVFCAKKLFQNINDKRVNNAINDLSSEKVSYVFIEINPSIVLSLKGKKVVDVACLNEDCMKMYDDIKIKDKDLNDSIKTLYSLAKDNGFDVSNGVSVKSTENVSVDKKLDYVNVSYIKEEERNELLSKVVNNDTIVKSDNKNYYEKLYDRLKKDNDYDEVYTCNMNNEKLECYFLEEAITPMFDVTDGSIDITSVLQNNLFTIVSRIERTLNKFNIENTYDEDMTDTFSNKVIINGLIYSFVFDYTNNENNMKNVFYRNVTSKGECVDFDGYKYCTCKQRTYVFKASEMNLLNPADVLNKLVVYNSLDTVC